MDSTVSHDELSSKLKLAVLGVISTALAGKKGRIIQYPFQFFRITHNLNTVALMMKFCSTWALGQILHLDARDALMQSILRYDAESHARWHPRRGVALQYSSVRYGP